MIIPLLLLISRKGSWKLLEKNSGKVNQNVDKDPEVATMLAKAYIGTDEEIKAVEIMSNALSRKHFSCGVLLETSTQRN
jgi:hypothetical protein